MKEHSLSVPRTARFYTLGTPSVQIKRLWIVCHGYGQLGRYFLRHFKVLDDGKTLVVAPEALSRFYLNGFSGRVGATWMTKETRLTEIEDQTTYLDLLLQNQLQHLPADVQVTVLGFSQGGATVCRWLAAAQPRVHQLILWATTFPEDIAVETGKNAFRNLRVTAVYGTQDTFISPELLARQQESFDRIGLQPQTYTFEGCHTIDAKTLEILNLS